MKRYLVGQMNENQAVAVLGPDAIKIETDEQLGNQAIFLVVLFLTKCSAFGQNLLRYSKIQSVWAKSSALQQNLVRLDKIQCVWTKSSVFEQSLVYLSKV